MEKVAEQRLQEARERGQLLDGMVIEIARKASEEGKLFGSVNTVDIVDAVVSRGATLEKSEIHLAEGALKTLGEHEVSISLHPEVHVNIKIIIVAEE